jgi:hypothetical protein
LNSSWRVGKTRAEITPISLSVTTPNKRMRVWLLMDQDGGLPEALFLGGQPVLRIGLEVRRVMAFMQLT